jgi:hypothetical protein
MAPPRANPRQDRRRKRPVLNALHEDLEARVVPAVIGPASHLTSAALPPGTIAPVVTVTPDSGSGSPSGYTPQQLRAAYGFDQINFGSVVGDGEGQTIAIVDAYDDPDLVASTASNFSTSDLAEFDSAFGLPNPPSFTKLNEAGNASPMPGTDPAGAGNSSGNWEYEESMDVEWAHAMAPAASIVLVEANSSSSGDLYAALNTADHLPGVSVVSLSWGSSEFEGENDWDENFQTPSGHEGITFVASSGDAGSPGIYPAYSPDVVAVGGTTVQLNSNGSIESETAWSGSGGGTSAYETEPSYQKGVQDTGYRTIPDVAFDADRSTGVAVYDSYDNTGGGPWVEMGGTSLGAPSWAALIAIADQGRVAAGGTTLNGATQTLPALYSLPSADFHDITSGSNGAFSAGPGYDEVTGLGTPVANLLAPGLAFYGMSDHLAIASQPSSSVTGGQGFGLVVDVDGPDGSIDTGATGTLTISLSHGSGSGSLSGTLTATINQGVATFSGLSVDQVGSGYTLVINGSGLASVTSSSFAVTPSAAAQLLIATQPPSSVTAGSTFGLTVDVEDAYGNLVTGYSGSVTLTLAGGPSGANLAGTLSVSVSNGAASFSGLSIDQVAGGYTIQASAPGLTTATTTTVGVTPGTAAQLVVEAGLPATVTAGASFGLTVSVEDAYGNLESSYDSNVTIALIGGPSGAGLIGTLVEPAKNGVANFSGLSIDQADSGYQLQAQASGIASADTAAFSVSPATASKLVFGSEPATSITAGSAFGLTADVEDVYGNIVTGYSGNVTLSLAGGPTGGSLLGALSEPATGGVATFSGLSIDQAGSSYVLQAQASGIASAETPGISITPASPAQLVLTSQPANSITAGNAFGLTVNVEDAYGNVVTGYSGTVTLGLTGGNLLGTLSESATGGVATFFGLSIDEAGTGDQLQASAPGLAPTESDAFTVTPAAAAQLVVESAPPPSIMAGTAFGLTVDAEDAYGNLVTGYSGSIALTLAGTTTGGKLLGTLNASASSGVATFSGLSIDEAGEGYAIDASASGLTPATTTTVGVTPAAPAQIVFNSGHLATVTAGESFGVSLSVEDAYGNLETSYNGSVTIAVAGGPTGSHPGDPTTAAASGGLVTFSGLDLTRAGSGYTIDATIGNLIAAQSVAFTVSPAAPAQLVILQQPPATNTAGAAFDVDVAVEDAFGNLVTSADNDVSLSLLGSTPGTTLGGTTTTAAAGGVASFDNLKLDQVGSQFAIQASSPGLRGATTNNLSVLPARPAQLVITMQPPASVTAGSGFALGVSVEDAYGNVETGFDGTVTVSLKRGPNGAAVSGKTTVQAVQGVATFSGLTIDKAGVGDVLNVVADGAGSLSTSAFQVVPAAPRQLVIDVQPPGQVAAGQSFGFTVAAEDSYGNVVTSFKGTVTASLAENPAGSSLSGVVSTSAVNGVANFSGLVLDKAGSGYAIAAASAGLASSPSNSMTVAPAAPSRLIITVQPPGDVAVKRPFAMGFEAVDAFGNVATDFDGIVTADLGANPDHNKLSGTLSVQANGGEAMITDATLKRTGKSYVITITSGGLTPAATSVFNVTRPPVGSPTAARRLAHNHRRSLEAKRVRELDKSRTSSTRIRHDRPSHKSSDR